MAAKTALTQGTIVINARIDEWAEQFLIDRRVRGLSKGTLEFYQTKLKAFLEYCESQLITEVEQLTPMILRRYLIYLEERGHKPGGVHAAYRTIRAYLNWWEDEVEPEGWKNPSCVPQPRGEDSVRWRGDLFTERKYTTNVT